MKTKSTVARIHYNAYGLGYQVKLICIPLLVFFLKPMSCFNSFTKNVKTDFAIYVKIICIKLPTKHTMSYNIMLVFTNWWN